jgi:hypothetical protein
VRHGFLLRSSQRASSSGGLCEGVCQLSTYSCGFDNSTPTANRCKWTKWLVHLTPPACLSKSCQNLVKNFSKTWTVLTAFLSHFRRMEYLRAARTALCSVRHLQLGSYSPSLLDQLSYLSYVQNLVKCSYSPKSNASNHLLLQDSVD